MCRREKNRMIEKPPPAYLAVGAMLLGFLLLGIVIGVWLADDETFREWVGALSGWIAAAGAFATAFLLLDQLDDQKKQTRFVTGDLEPEFFPEPDDGNIAGVRTVSIHNWNIRGMTVEALVALTPSNVFPTGLGGAIVTQIQKGEVTPAEAEQPFANGIFLDGWTARNSRPVGIRPQFILWNEDGTHYAGEAVVEIKYSFIAEPKRSRNKRTKFCALQAS